MTPVYLALVRTTARKLAAGAAGVAAGARDIAFPPTCTFCRAPLLAGEGDRGRLAICAACWPLLPVVGNDLCLRCGTPQGPSVGRVEQCVRCPSDFGGVSATVAVGRYVAPSLAVATARRGARNQPLDDREAAEVGDDRVDSDDDLPGPADSAETPHAAGDTEEADLLDRGELADELQRGPTMLRDVILRLKHQGGLDVAPTLGGLIAGEVLAREWAIDIDGVVPVPLHWRRVMERRFNQAEEIGRAVAARLRVPLLPLLQRTRYTANQTSLPRLSRRSNVSDAFALAGRFDRALSWWRLRRLPDRPPLASFLRVPGADEKQKPKPLAGRSLLLIDDVMTTGSTMAACARVLRRAGATRVYAAVVARV